MAKKYTKRAYLADVAKNDADTARVAAILADLNAKCEAGTITPDEIDRWNEVYDMEWQYSEERRAIERKWSTRNWTAADHDNYALVAANVD